MSIEIICLGCGERGEIEKVASRVIHACGSDNVDLWMGTPNQIQRAASYAQGPIFGEFMRDAAHQPGMAPPTGQDDNAKHWPGYVGDEITGWNQYEGPGPSENPTTAPVHTDLTPRAPTRPIPGQVGFTNNYVYDKHNPDPGYGSEVPEPPVAKHNDSSHTTTTPFLGRHKQEEVLEGIPLKGASCPRCGTADTAIVADYRDHAHWFCGMRLCGSLVNLDQHPDIDPYHPPRDGRGWQETYRKDKRVFAGKKNGQVFARMTAIARTNPGLNLPEVVHLARQSVINYPEA
jgi:ribosomal protein S27AE